MDYDEELYKAWVDAAMVKAYDFAEAYCNHQCDGENDRLNEMNMARRSLREHLIAQPAGMEMTDQDLRAVVELQLKEIDRMHQHLRDEGDRISELRGALHSLESVARRYLPDYDEHPEIQKADEVLVPNAELNGLAPGEDIQ